MSYCSLGQCVISIDCAGLTINMLYLLLIAGSLVAGVWLRWRHKHRRLLGMAAKMPGPPTVPLLGNALCFIRQPEGLIRVLKELTTLYGDVLRFWLGPDLNIVISDPDDLKILLTNSKTNVKGPQYKYMADALGGGILSGSGITWRKHRKIALPNYGKRAIESYGGIFNDEVGYLLQSLRKKLGKQFDVYDDVVKTTSYAVCQTLMGLTREQTLKLPYLQEVIDETPKLYDVVFDRMTKWYLQIDPVFWLTQYYRQQKHFISITTEFSKQIVDHRIESIKIMGDDVKILMDSVEDSTKNTQLSAIDRLILSNELHGDELLKETFTIFTSSQEASAKMASFLLLMMAYHPKCQEKLYEEIVAVIGKSDRPVTDEDLKNMPYLDMVFKEVLRLFPIGALLQRTITEDIETKSCTLPAGCSLVVPIYHLHRDPRFWDDPENFDPDRFNPETTKARHPYCYIPFSLGPMDCLGRYFGTKLVKTICIRVLQEFEVTSLQTYQDMKIMIAISVASVNGFHVTLRPRPS